jgi:CBS domain-containing protein
MQVRDVMVGPPVCCSSKTNLGEAAEIMWNQNCGILPIVNIQNKVIGVVTDRDLFIALATRNRLPGELTVGDVTNGHVYSCKPDDDIHSALGKMGEGRVRRLPVLDHFGKVVGILSMDDIILDVQMGEHPDLSSQDVVHALKRLYGPRLPQLIHRKVCEAA